MRVDEYCKKLRYGNCYVDDVAGDVIGGLEGAGALGCALTPGCDVVEAVFAAGAAGYAGYEAYEAYESSQQNGTQTLPQDYLDGSSCYLPFPPDEFGGLNINSFDEGRALSDAALGHGNFDVGETPREEADQAGRDWVGPGARELSNGSALISADGRRVYRRPAYKPKEGKTQANLIRRNPDTGEQESNAHIDITD